MRKIAFIFTFLTISGQQPVDIFRNFAAFLEQY